MGETSGEDRTARPYRTPYEHLLDEIERVYLIAESAIRRQWTMAGLQQRLDAPLSRLLGVTEIAPAESQRARLDELEGVLARHAVLVHERAALTLRTRVRLPLVDLAQRFGLDEFQVTVLLLALAPEVDARIATLYGYLLRDRGRQWIDVALMADLICTNAWLRGRLFTDLADYGSLRRHHLIELLPAEAGVPAALLYRPLKVNAALVHFALGARLEPAIHEALHTDAPALDELVYDDTVLALAPQMAQALRPDPEQPLVVLAGRMGVGKRSLVKTIAARNGLHVLELDAATLPPDPVGMARRLTESLLRGTLNRCACYVTGVDEIVPDSAEERLPDPRFHVLLQCLEQHVGPVAIGCSRSVKHLSAGRRPVLHLSLAMPNAARLERIWQRELRLADLWLPPEQVRELAMDFAISGGTVHEAVAAVARTGAGPTSPPVRRHDFATAVGGIISTRLGKLTQRVENLATWDDFIADEGLVERVRGVIARHRHRDKVLREWGFGARLRLDTGVAALFWGPPGTGKSMVAGLIARELGFEVYQVDLAMVMSKWLGETEKNLAQIFDEAESGRVVLLFDEADSLFSKRTSEGESAQAQALSQRVNYILTRLERFRGVAILTSNREKAIDEAFERRLAAKVHFPLPDAAQRVRIWRRMLGPAVGSDVDLRQFSDCELAGGHIRNVCVAAAFAAAGRGEPLTERHVCAALVQLYDDQGRIAPSWLRSPA